MATPGRQTIYSMIDLGLRYNCMGGRGGVETEGGKGGCHVTGRGSPGCLQGAHQNM